MTALEKVLARGLEEHPGDWAIRLELAGKLVGRGAGHEAAALLEEAPEPPDTEDQFQRALDLGLGTLPETHRNFLSAFVGRRPHSAWARHAYARALALEGDLEAASGQYMEALALDLSVRDPDLEDLLEGREEDVLTWDEATPVETESPGSPETQAPYTPPLPESIIPLGPVSTHEDGATAPSEEYRADIIQLPPRDSVDSSGGKRSPWGWIRWRGGTREKLSSFTVALLLHLGLLVALAFVILPRRTVRPPELVAFLSPEPEEAVRLEEQRIQKKVPRKQAETASASLSLIAPAARSAALVPSYESQALDLGPVGLLDGIGAGPSYSPGGNEGSISFFGSMTRAKKVVYVVDFSNSMHRGGRERLTKRELSRSVEQLPEGTLYQVIFYAGPAWYAGQKVKANFPFPLNGYLGNVVEDGDEEYVWYEGWDKEHRQETSGFHYCYDKGTAELPRAGYLKADEKTRKETLRDIRRVELVNGTDWRWPLRMAINLEPETIYFMTDGVFGEVEVEEEGLTAADVIDELLAYNQAKAKSRINTVCMKEISARAELEQLASGTGGEFTLVLGDGTWVRGKELDEYDTEQPDLPVDPPKRRPPGTLPVE